MPIRCKKPGCAELSFKTLSDLRKHQWKAHPETFQNNLKKMREARHKKSVQAKKIGRPPGKKHASSGQEPTLREVILLLETKRDFLDEVIEDLKRMQS